MVNEGPWLVITYSVYWVSYRPGILNLDLSDSSSVYIRYNCDTADFVVDHVQLDGI